MLAAMQLQRLAELTHGTQPESCTFGTHHEVEGHRSSLVPAMVSVLLGMVCGQGQRKAATYKLDSNLLVVEKICAFENDAEGTLSNLFPNPVVHTHHVRRRRGHFERAGCCLTMENLVSLKGVGKAV